jgi:hypothetical protein
MSSRRGEPLNDNIAFRPRSGDLIVRNGGLAKLVRAFWFIPRQLLLIWLNDLLRRGPFFLPRPRDDRPRSPKSTSVQCTINVIQRAPLQRAQLSSTIFAVAVGTGHTERTRRLRDFEPSSVAVIAATRADNHKSRNLRRLLKRRLSIIPQPLISYALARASPASRTSILRSSVPVVTRSGKSSRRVLLPACMSMPSGSQPVQRQSAPSAPSSLVA